MCAVPLLWLLLAPSKDNGRLLNGYPLAFGSFGGYVRAWQHLADFDGGIIFRWALNTVLYSGAIVLIAGFSSIMAGYALATTRMFGRRTLLMLTLTAMIVPSAALVLPLFLEVNAVHMIGSAWAVILPSALFPFGVYLSFIHFSTALPRSVLEAARVDGASEWRIFTQIALPTSKSLIGLVAFFTFAGAWNNYFLPYVMLTSDHSYTLQLGLPAVFQTSIIVGAPSNSPILEPEVALACLVLVLPVAILFIFFQRFLARGVLGGAVKG